MLGFTKIFSYAALSCFQFLGLSLLFVGIVSPISAAEVLGRFSPGAFLELEIDESLPSTRLRVEIDGEDVPFSVSFDRVTVAVPSELTGLGHTIRVLRRDGSTETELGVWLFEIENLDQVWSASILADLGFRANDTEVEDFASGTFSLGLETADQRLRFGTTVGYNPDLAEDELTVSELFIEGRFAILGDAASLRFGSQQAFATTVITDEAARRGLRLRLEDPGQVYDVSLFAVGLDTDSGPKNLSGLENQEARVAGLSFSYQPTFIAGTIFEFEAFDGKSDILPLDSIGTNRAFGARLTSTNDNGRFGLNAGIATSEWADSSGAPSNSGNALDAEATIRFSNAAASADGILTFAASAVDAGFFSSMNPELLVGEIAGRAAVEVILPGWDLLFETNLAHTNHNGPATDPIDELRGYGAAFRFDPGDFTGGFLNGMAFYGTASLVSQDRIETPVGAPAPEDNTVTTVSIGAEKIQPDRTWGLFLTRSQIDDRAGLGIGETSTFLDAHSTFDIGRSISADVTARAGVRQTTSGDFNEWELSASATQTWADGLAEATIAASISRSEDPSAPEGSVISGEVVRWMRDGIGLVGSIAHGEGTLAPDGAGNDGWVASILLRADLSLSGP